MRILHYINNLKREGAQVVVKNLVSATDQERIGYLVAVRQPGGALVDEIRERFDQDVERFSNLTDAAVLAWLVSRKLKLPLVITHHGYDILPQCGLGCRLVYLLLLRLAARSAAVNIAVSSSVAEQVRKRLGLQAHRIRTIANGVPVPDAARIDRLAPCQRGQADTAKRPTTLDSGHG